jgi:hypothetical protein
VSTDIQDPPQPTAASLLSGILGDLHQLVEQQFQLTRREIEEEIRQRMAALAVLALGLAALFFGALMACLTLTLLLHWSALPAGSDAAWLPLWACHAVVAAILIVVGAILAQVGQAKFRAIDPYHNPATQFLQEPTP